MDRPEGPESKELKDCKETKELSVTLGHLELKVLVESLVELEILDQSEIRAYLVQKVAKENLARLEDRACKEPRDHLETLVTGARRDCLELSVQLVSEVQEERLANQERPERKEKKDLQEPLDYKANRVCLDHKDKMALRGLRENKDLLE